MRPGALRFRRCGVPYFGRSGAPLPAVSRTAAFAARRKIVKTAGDRGRVLPGRGGYGADAQYLGSPLQMANPFSGTQYSMQAP